MALFVLEGVGRALFREVVGVSSEVEEEAARGGGVRGGKGGGGKKGEERGERERKRRKPFRFFVGLFSVGEGGGDNLST